MKRVILPCQRCEGFRAKQILEVIVRWTTNDIPNVHLDVYECLRAFLEGLDGVGSFLVKVDHASGGYC